MRRIPTRKLRKDSRWNDLSESQRQHVRRLMDEEGIEEVVAYCASINKPWSKGRISEFFTAERKAALAEADQIRCETAALQEVVRACRAEGMELDEAAALELARKLRQIITVKTANPDTPEGIGLIFAAAKHITGLRVAQLRDAERRDRKTLKERELDQRETSKIEAGLKQIEKEVGKNSKVKAALDQIREALAA